MKRLVISMMAMLIWSEPTLSNMVVDRTIIRFDSSQASRQDVQIANTGEETLYLQIEVFEVQRPGTDAEEQLRLSDPNAISLLATPNKMILPGGSRKLLRLVNLAGNSDVERIYRVNVRPVIGELEANTMAVKIIVAYQLLVIVRPNEPLADLGYEREGKRITFRNDGNTNVLLHSGEQCAADANGECARLKPRRLYAGNRWQVMLPYDGPLEYSVTIGEANVRQRFD